MALLARGVGRWTSPRGQLLACSAIHVVNDALFAGLYPLLPLIAADLGLTYAEVGAIKTAFSGAAAVLQVPAGMAAERWGEQLLLALGTGWVGLGLLAMALTATFWPLLLAALAAGVGGNVQHPVASSVVSRLYERGGRSTAMGTLNFAGDLGKIVAPAIAGGVALVYGWRGGLLALSAIGAVFAVVYGLVVPRPRGLGAAGQTASERADEGRPVGGWGIARPGLFAVLTAVGMLDGAARGTALTFIPFLFDAKGLDAASMSFYFAVLFGAGAAGKFICGPIGDRFGNVWTIAITELVTAGALLGLLGASAGWVVAALLPLGFVLNGTSSVLYATVADLVHASRRARGYGLYYTGTLLASAASPIAYGWLADRVGLGPTFVTLAAVTAAIAPLVLFVGRGLRGPAVA